jgi:hypothetical protein
VCCALNDSQWRYVCHGTFWPVLERYLEGLELYRNGMTSRIILIPSVFCATLRKVPTKHHDSQPPRSGYSAAGLFSCLLPIMFFWRLALICYLAVPVQSQAGSSCTVFSTNGIAASNFQYYRFFDFRNLHGATHQRGEKVLKATQDLKNKTVSDATWMDD